MVVLKMRGSDHDKRLRGFEITPGGIDVVSDFSNYEGVMTGSPKKVASDRFVEMFRKAGKKEVTI